MSQTWQVRVLIAPDSFGGTLSASEAATAIAIGFAVQNPQADLVQRPLSDGGPGFISAISSALGGELIPMEVHGPNGNKVAANWLRVDEVAYLESATAIGLHLANPTQALTASSYGLGEVIQAASENCSRIVIGLGGTAVSDGGAGMMAALAGIEFSSVNPLCAGASRLREIDKWPVIEINTEIVVATDVDAPLHGQRGAAHGFAKQKGASDAEIEEISVALAHWAGLITRAKFNPALALGAGAGGGVGFGLLALGAKRVSGADLLIDITSFEQELAVADLIVTGEGRLDWQTADGKLVARVARLSQNYAKPAIALAGEVELTPRECQQLGLAAAYSMTELIGAEQSLAQPFSTLQALATRLARTWL